MAPPRGHDLPAFGPKAPLLIVHGTDAAAVPKGTGFRVGGYSDVYKLMPPGVPVAQVNLGRQFAGTRALPDPARFERVLNLVTDADQHPRTLDRVAKLLRGFPGQVVNRPEAVMRTTRDLGARRLAGIEGLHVPASARLRNPRPGAAAAAAERAGIAFPAIVRQAGTHSGRTIRLVADAAELDAACTGPGDHIVTEFVDFRSADGLYRKYRLWSFGKRTIFRHLAIADEWNVHIGKGNRFMFDRPELIDEEVRLMARTEGAFPQAVHDTFNAVRDRLGLDFFGLDFGFTPSGAMVLFEANATMSFFPLVVDPRFSYRKQLLQPAMAAFAAMLFPDDRG